MDLKFADLLIEDLKIFYESKGKIDKGGYGTYCNDDFISFGCCDTSMPLSDIISDPTVKELGLISEADIKAGNWAAMRNVYARFYNYLGNRIKKEFPGKRFVALVYYNSQYPGVDKRYPMPDNMEINLCWGGLPLGLLSADRLAETEKIFKDWYEALGKRPAMKTWLYAPHPSNRLNRTVGAEFSGLVPQLLGDYFGREGGIFYDWTGGEDVWNYFYSFYNYWRIQWNPAFDVDASVDEMMLDLAPGEVGRRLGAFHRSLRKAVRDRTVSGKITVATIDALEKEAKAVKESAEASGDERQKLLVELVVDYVMPSFDTLRTLVTYEPPLYQTKRLPSSEADWASLPVVPLLDNRLGSPTKLPVEARFAWDEKGVYGRVKAAYAPMADESKDMWANDSIEIFFSPGLKKEVRYQFAFDVLGREYTSKQRLKPVIQPRETNYKGEGFTHEVKIAADGYEAKFFLPWTVFEEKAAPKVYDNWNANLVVNRHSEPKAGATSSLTLNNNGNLSMFGILRFNGYGD